MSNVVISTEFTSLDIEDMFDIDAEYEQLQQENRAANLTNVDIEDLYDIDAEYAQEYPEEESEFREFIFDTSLMPPIRPAREPLAEMINDKLLQKTTPQTLMKSRVITPKMFANVSR